VLFRSSIDGQYQTFISENNYPASIYFSTDYGETWVKNADIQDRLRDCAMSYDGKYQTLAGFINLYTTVLNFPSPVELAIAAKVSLRESENDIQRTNENQAKDTAQLAGPIVPIVPIV
jgi:hypothetical protein